MAAALDLEEISDYLRFHHPAFSGPTVTKIYDSAKSLKRNPEKGRIGHLVGTRELVLAPLPYVILYSVDLDAVNLLRILHTSRDWSGLQV
jgi:plasmid stabilization system protein ParE